MLKSYRSLYNIKIINFFRERKKLKVGGLATLRKKLMRRRRSSKACDHGRVIREAVGDWSGIEIAALLDEYEALAALKDLSVQVTTHSIFFYPFSVYLM